MPVAAFVALAAIGIIAAGLNAGPAYEAMLDMPNLRAEAAEASTVDSATGASGGEGADAEGSAAEGAEGADGAIEVADAEGAIAVEAAAGALDLSAIPFSEEVSAFSATGSPAPSLAQAALDPVRQAFADVTDGGVDAGFVFMNLESGAGISANADKAVYGASSIKGPFAVYVCEELVEHDETTLDATVRSLNDNFVTNGSASVKTLVTNAVTQSSNGSFASLRKAYGGEKYASWLESLGVDDGIHENGDWFAWYTARDAAKLWTEAYAYLGSGTETAEWLGGLMEDTNVSYIRDGASSLKVKLEEQEWAMPPAQASPTKLIKTTADSVSGYRSKAAALEGATFRNKAGWCVSDAGSSVDYDSTSDNGIVTIDGTDYLLCIMTGAPYSDRSAEKVSNLAASLMAVYGELA